MAANASDLPPLSAASSKGVENLWFEVMDRQNTQFALDADTLSAIERIEIRDHGHALLAVVNTAIPNITLSLAPGRYQALVHARATAIATVPVFARYATVPEGEKAQLQAVTAPERVRPQYSLATLARGAIFSSQICLRQT